MSDALSKALAMRRGQSLDGALYAQPAPMDAVPGEVGAPPTQDQAKGDSDGHPAVDDKAGLHENPHQLETDHVEEHIPVASGAAADPAMDAEIAMHVMDGAGAGDYEAMQGMKPRSLGERAKMMALKDKYQEKK